MLYLFRDTRFIHQVWFACISLYLFAMPMIEIVALLAIFKIFEEIGEIRRRLLINQNNREFTEWLDERHNREAVSLAEVAHESEVNI